MPRRRRSRGEAVSSSEAAQVRFWSPEFFVAAASSLNGSPALSPLLQWLEARIIAESSDTGASFLICVKDGVITTRQAAAGDEADFRLSAPYDEWVYVVRDGANLHREIAKGSVKFTGSLPEGVLLLGKSSAAEREMAAKMRSMKTEYAPGPPITRRPRRSPSSADPG